MLLLLFPILGIYFLGSPLKLQNLRLHAARIRYDARVPAVVSFTVPSGLSAATAALQRMGCSRRLLTPYRIGSVRSRGGRCCYPQSCHPTTIDGGPARICSRRLHRRPWQSAVCFSWKQLANIDRNYSNPAARSPGRCSCCRGHLSVGVKEKLHRPSHILAAPRSSPPPLLFSAVVSFMLFIRFMGFGVGE